MALTYSYQSTSDEPFVLNDGEYLARCVGVYDLGQQEVTYDGETRLTPKVFLDFEVFSPGGTQTASANRIFNAEFKPRSHLRLFLESWRGRGFTASELDNFNIGKLLGVYGLITIGINRSNGKSYTNIDAIDPVPKTTFRPAGKAPLKLLDFAQPNLDVFNSLPEWIRNKILNAADCPSLFSGKPEPQPSFVPQNNSGFDNSEDDDDIPF